MFNIKLIDLREYGMVFHTIKLSRSGYFQLGTYYLFHCKFT